MAARHVYEYMVCSILIIVTIIYLLVNIQFLERKIQLLQVTNNRREIPGETLVHISLISEKLFKEHNYKCIHKNKQLLRLFTLDV